MEDWQWYDKLHEIDVTTSVVQLLISKGAFGLSSNFIFVFQKTSGPILSPVLWISKLFIPVIVTKNLELFQFYFHYTQLNLGKYS
jgi:hypothetical protein